MTFLMCFFGAVIVTLLIVYFVKKTQLKNALEKVKVMLAKHEEKVFIEEIKKEKNRNFVKTNGKDENV